MSTPPLSDEDAKALARQRFFALAFLRFSGVIFALCGIAMMVGKLPIVHGTNARYLGLFIALVGAFDVIVLPVFLARRWKSGK